MALTSKPGHNHFLSLASLLFLPSVSLKLSFELEMADNGFLSKLRINTGLRVSGRKRDRERESERVRENQVYSGLYCTFYCLEIREKLT